jgi:N-acetylglucosamine-6-phosphate deacetylase
MAPIGAREPGVAGVALARDDVTVLCIADGVHLADETLRLILAAARGRVALTSDAIAAARRGEGTYTLGTVTVTVSDGRATRADGTLAGGLSSVIDGLRHAVRLGASLEQAADAAAGAPARLLGRSDIGALRPGSTADVIVLDDALELRQIICDGEPVEPEDR